MDHSNLNDADPNTRKTRSRLTAESEILQMVGIEECDNVDDFVFSESNAANTYNNSNMFLSTPRKFEHRSSSTNLLTPNTSTPSARKRRCSPRKSEQILVHHDLDDSGLTIDLDETLGLDEMMKSSLTLASPPRKKTNFASHSPDILNETFTVRPKSRLGNSEEALQNDLMSQIKEYSTLLVNDSENWSFASVVRQASDNNMNLETAKDRNLQDEARNRLAQLLRQKTVDDEMVETNKKSTSACDWMSEVDEDKMPSRRDFKEADRRRRFSSKNSSLVEHCFPMPSLPDASSSNSSDSISSSPADSSNLSPATRMLSRRPLTPPLSPIRYRDSSVSNHRVGDSSPVSSRRSSAFNKYTSTQAGGAVFRRPFIKSHNTNSRFYRGTPYSLNRTAHEAIRKNRENEKYPSVQNKSSNIAPGSFALSVTSPCRGRVSSETDLMFRKRSVSPEWNPNGRHRLGVEFSPLSVGATVRKSLRMSAKANLPRGGNLFDFDEFDSQPKPRNYYSPPPKPRDEGQLTDHQHRSMNRCGNMPRDKTPTTNCCRRVRFLTTCDTTASEDSDDSYASMVAVPTVESSVSLQEFASNNVIIKKSSSDVGYDGDLDENLKKETSPDAVKNGVECWSSWSGSSGGMFHVGTEEDEAADQMNWN